MVTSASTALFLFRRPTLKHEGPWVRAFHIAGFDGINLKPGCPDQVVRLTIEVTAPADPSRYGVRRCCQRAIRISGDRPCSTKSNLPPGLRTRRISISAAIGLGIESLFRPD